MSVATAPPFHIRYRKSILLVMIAIAAILRFSALDRPRLWGDEALTYSRVIGSWDDLFTILRSDGFMPLHYVLYWLLGKMTTLTPGMMRVIPSLCGVLMVPAMYFLVRQISTVGAALLAAAFACTSAYLMRYSHDAKMYIQTWTFIALNLGCLFWWLRTEKWMGYFTWIITGIVAGGFSALAMLMLLPQVLIFFTARKFRVGATLLFILGVIVIASPVAIYMTQVNRWAERTGAIPSLASKDSPGNWEESGISWVEWYNTSATGPTLVRSSLSAYLVGWEWPIPFGLAKIISDFVLASHYGVMIFLALAGLLAMLPWRNPESAESNFRPWQRFLWIGLLLLIPCYGIFYCRSVPDFHSPFEVIRDTIKGLGYWNLYWLIILFLGWYYGGDSIRQRFRKSLPWFVSILLLITVCQAMYLMMRYQHDLHWKNIAQAYGPGANRENMPHLAWKSIWMPRYVGIIVPALYAGICILIMRLPRSWIRRSVIVVLLGFNLISSITRLVADSEPPLDRFMTDAKASRDSQGQTRVVITTLDPKHLQKSLFLQSSWYGLYGSTGKYYASIILDLKPTPFEFREGDLPLRYRDLLGDLIDPEEIISYLTYTNPSLNRPPERLIVWDHSNEDAEYPEQIPQPDRVVTSLSAQWKQVGNEEIYYQYDANFWSEKGFNRRRVFEKIAKQLQ